MELHISRSGDRSGFAGNFSSLASSPATTPAAGPRSKNGAPSWLISCRDLGGRPSRGSDDPVPHPLRLLLHPPRAPGADAIQRHGHPTAAWTWQQLINATAWGRLPRYLIHDRDAVYGKEFTGKLARIGVPSVRITVRARRANWVAERLVRPYGRKFWPTSSCSMSGTCTLSCPTSPATTTTNAYVDRCEWQRQSADLAEAPVLRPHDRFSEDFIISTRGLLEA